VAIPAVLYTWQLDRVPAFLTLDEAHFSVHAAAIAKTGRNLNGDVLPLLVSLEDPGGETYHVPWGYAHYLPFGIYLIAGALQFLPLDEASVRLPAAVLGGAVNVALLYLMAWLLFRSRVAAVCGAAVLAFTPANLIISRQALDLVCQLPFTLGALACLAAYLRRPDPRLALAAGAILGGGVYAYVTSLFFMPLFLALFWAVSGRNGVLTKQAWLLSAGGFAVALLPMALWLWSHPEAFRSIRIQYLTGDPSSVSMFEHVARDGIVSGGRELLRVYWSYFDPAFLFVQGGNARNLSTGEIGVFVAAVAVLAPLGLYYLRSSPALLIVLAGLLTAPLPAAVKGAPYQIHRASGLLVFVSLIAGYGLAMLWQSPRWRARVLATALITVSALQFAAFYRDYFSSYRVSSAHSYDPTAFGTVAEVLARHHAQHPITRVFLPAGYYDVGAKWRFYLTKLEIEDLRSRTQYYSRAADDLVDAAVDSIALLPDGVEAISGWATIATISNLMGAPTATLIRRVPD